MIWKGNFWICVFSWLNKNQDNMLNEKKLPKWPPKWSSKLNDGLSPLKEIHDGYKQICFISKHFTTINRHTAHLHKMIQHFGNLTSVFFPITSADAPLMILVLYDFWWGTIYMAPSSHNPLVTIAAAFCSCLKTKIHNIKLFCANTRHILELH